MAESERAATREITVHLSTSERLRPNHGVRFIRFKLTACPISRSMVIIQMANRFTTVVCVARYTKRSNPQAKIGGLDAYLQVGHVLEDIVVLLVVRVRRLAKELHARGAGGTASRVEMLCA